MSHELKIKIIYKDLPKKALINKLNILDNKYSKYEEIQKLIFKKSENAEYNKIKVTEKDKFVLEIEECEIEGIKEIWDQDTYNYFYEKITQNPPEKLKLFIVKKDYPKGWKPPKASPSKIKIEKEPIQTISSRKEEKEEKISNNNEEIKLEDEQKKKNGTEIRVYYQEEPNKLLFKKNILDNICSKYAEMRKLILEKSEKKKECKNYKVTEENKFVLEIDGFKLNDLNEVWNEATYKYFYDSVIEKMPGKIIKLIIVKVNEYKNWKPPEYYTILEKSLNTEWDSTKKEIEHELTEKFLEEGKKLYIQEKEIKKINESIANLNNDISNIHFDIICHTCLNPNFMGVRYLCSECHNYNLCECCYEKTHFSHNPQHVFMKINKPIENDYQKFNYIFYPNKMSLKQIYEPFEIKIDIINNGEEPLQGCFLSPIRFGKQYLGCLKTSIVDKCATGDKVTLEPLITFDDEDNNQPKDEYEGYFRLMTEDGIPFGDILYIQVLIKD